MVARYNDNVGALSKKRKGTIMKKMQVFFLCLLAIFTLTACGQEKGKTEKKASEPERTKVAYQESVVTLPEGVTSIEDVVQSEDNTLFLIGGNSDATQLSYWKSKDNGNSWEKLADYTNRLSEKGMDSTVRLANDGTGFVQMWEKEKAEKDPENTTVERYFLEKDFSLKPVSESVNETLKKEKAYTIDKLNDEKLLLTSWERGTFFVDIKTGKETEIYSQKDMILGKEVAKDTLYVVMSGKGEQVSISTGKKEKASAPFSKMVKLSEGKMGEPAAFGILKNSKDTFFCANDKHFYRVTGEKQEILFDKSKTMLGDVSISISKILPYGKDAFLVVTDDGKGGKLIRYEAKGERKQASKKLKVYTLKDDGFKNRAVKQVINLYQRKHEDVDVELEIGSENNEIPTDEALKKLNARLASGDAPDILVLDGLNVEKYQNQKIFSDITEVIEKNKTGDNFQNVLTTYEKDGKYYGLPLVFGAFCMYAPNGVEQETKTLDDMTNSLVKLSKSSKTPVFGSWDYNNLNTIFYRSYMAPKGKNLSEKDVENFYENMKKLYGLVNMKEVEKTKKVNESDISLLLGGGVSFVTTGETQTSFDYLSVIDDIKSYELADKVKNYPTTFLRDKEKMFFIPRNSLSIVKSSKNQDEAMEFLNLAIANETQDSLEAISGLPMNKKTFANQIKATLTENIEEVRTETGGKVKVPFGELTEETVNKWIEKLEQLNTPNNVDEILFQIIIKNMDDILTGETSVKDGTKQTMNRVKLYLSE
ncbi:ABC-type glycerol-3-phosphate transport system, substrate-binding protein [Pilibacter termitis]|uniref:ABC-type glycerol-3-phosphate transport system, substrate-binding protein n=1 Tax=Pilibacter termitis TaxID=263852 RepID=A0A1T4RBX4_9ENTE|nr:ABC transporter substrate-binding protein [Pilibacter termitis]SKA13208.1 ABC-type glycerol-3-phosphate transport system, substrate-binding protein [Pilibacter termitis]